LDIILRGFFSFSQVIECLSIIVIIAFWFIDIADICGSFYAKFIFDVLSLTVLADK